MADTIKKKISAKEIATDIRSGMGCVELKSKYELSDKSLESICKKLSEAGSVTEQDLARLKIGTETSRAPVRGKPDDGHWRCPACHAPQLREMRECPACGIVAAKFMAGREKRSSDSSVIHTPEWDNNRSGSNHWISAVVSVVAVALIGTAVIVWSVRRSDQKAKMAKPNKPRFQTSQQLAREPIPAEESSADEQSMSIDPAESEAESSQSAPIDPLPADATSLKPQDVPLEPVPVDLTPHKPIDAPSNYATGVLRRFTSADFKKEVVEASKTYPVIFQFYRDT